MSATALPTTVTASAHFSVRSCICSGVGSNSLSVSAMLLAEGSRSASFCIDRSRLLRNGPAFSPNSDIGRSFRPYPYRNRSVVAIVLRPHSSWHWPTLTDIHDRAAKPRKDVQNGDHGAETETASAVVLRCLQSRGGRAVPHQRQIGRAH